MVLAQLAEGEEFKGDTRWDLVQRVVASKPFRNSARLRDFLLYVSSCALRDQPEEATEQHIGIHVFGRRPGFNSTEDSIVRSQARLLRIKLAAYFSSPEGAGETVMIQIPKGHYLPVFITNPSDGHEDAALLLEREVSAVPLHGGDDSVASDASNALHVQTEAPLDSTVPQTQAYAPVYDLAQRASISSVADRKRSRLFWPFIVTAFVAIGAMSFLLGKGIASPAAPDNTVARLWRPFLTGGAPLVIYSNASFVGDSRTGMRYAQPDENASAIPGPIIDTYTGIGEVSAVHQITRLFDSHGADFILKRSRLVTWDEAKLHNLIFIGSIAENASLQVLAHAEEFTLVAEPGQAGFINRHPKPGEPSRYMRPEQPRNRDYAVVALRPGVDPSLRTFVFSGLSTLGTQAAVEFVTSPKNAEQLLSIAYRDGQIRPFEALLEVDISGGVPIQSRLVTIRLHE